jgi:hypothetical protein
VAVVVILLIVFLVSRRSRARREEEQRERSLAPNTSGRLKSVARSRTPRRSCGRVERQVKPLSEESRGCYEEQWGEVERVFVDNPERSIEMADRTVTDILGERKFVADASQSDEETERGLAAMHPEVADDYREARRIRASVVGSSAPGSEEGSGDGSSDESTEGTEELRQAIRHYRAVYEILQG